MYWPITLIRLLVISENYAYISVKRQHAISSHFLKIDLIKLIKLFSDSDYHMNDPNGTKV